MDAKTVNTAHTDAMWLQGTEKKAYPLTAKQQRGERSYIVSMSIIRAMLENGMITAAEYNQIDTIIAAKFGSYLSDLYR